MLCIYFYIKFILNVLKMILVYLSNIPDLITLINIYFLVYH